MLSLRFNAQHALHQITKLIMRANQAIQPVPDPGEIPEPEYQSKQQLAARLGGSSRTVDNLMVRGLPCLKLTGKLVHFPRAAVDNWLSR